MLASMVIMKARRETGRGGRNSAVGRDFERVPALVEKADQQEQRAGGDAVIQHLIHRAVACPACVNEKMPSTTNPR